MVLVLVPQGATRAASYSCGDTQSGHCYALVRISLTGITGGATDILTTHLNAGQGGSGWFIDNEEWLVNVGACGSNSWVEAGMIAFAYEAERYFWADTRTNDCSFNLHIFSDVPSGDYGNNTYFSVYQMDASDYGISVSSQTGYWSATSANNNLNPNALDQGMELAGQNSSSAPATPFTSRMYRYGSNWVNIDANYNTAINNPPNLHVTNSPQYGDFYTICCNVNQAVIKSALPKTPTIIPSHPLSPSLGAHEIDVGGTGKVTVDQVNQYAKTHAPAKMSMNGPINITNTSLMTSTQIANLLHGEQTGFSPDKTFWVVQMSGDFHLVHHGIVRAISHAYEIIDPMTGNLIMEGGN